MCDLIGDIHGHADELVQLLEILGYRKPQGVYGHPERKVIFLGDFIDTLPLDSASGALYGSPLMRVPNPV